MERSEYADDHPTTRARAVSAAAPYVIRVDSFRSSLWSALDASAVFQSRDGPDR